MPVDLSCDLDVGGTQVGGGSREPRGIRESHHHIAAVGASPLSTGGREAGSEQSRASSSKTGHVGHAPTAIVAGSQCHIEPGRVAEGHAVRRSNCSAVTYDPVGKHQVRGSKIAGGVPVDLSRDLDVGGTQVGGGSREPRGIRESHRHIAAVGASPLSTGGREAGSEQSRASSSKTGHVGHAPTAIVAGSQCHIEPGRVAEGHAVRRSNCSAVTYDPVGKHQVRGSKIAGGVPVDVFCHRNHVGGQIGHCSIQ